MALRTLDPTEDRNFAEGETIFDTDGNVFTVRDGRAVLNGSERGVNYNLASKEMRNCFSRANPNLRSGYKGRRATGSQFQIVDSTQRGDSCYQHRSKGWYHHDFTPDYAIDVPTIRGPFRTAQKALDNALGR